MEMDTDCSAIGLFDSMATLMSRNMLSCRLVELVSCCVLFVLSLLCVSMVLLHIPLYNFCPATLCSGFCGGRSCGSG